MSLSKNTWILLTVIIGLVTAWLFGSALSYGYVWDDSIWLSSLNANQGNILNEAFLRPFMATNKYWRPLGELTLYAQLGPNPAAIQHLINVMLHLVNISLISGMAWVAYRRGAQVFSGIVWFVVLAVFAFHPIFVEPVVWVSGRFDLLYTSLLLLLLGGYWLLAAGNLKTLLLGALYIAALLAKETAILTLPMLLLFGHILKPAENLTELIKRDKLLITFFVAISIVYLIARAQVLDNYGLALILQDSRKFALYDYVYKILATIGAYFQLLFVPFLDLSPVHPTNVMLTNPWYAIIGMLFLLVTGFLLMKRGTTRICGFIALAFLLSLVLVINIIPEGFANNLVQNRYLYPSLAYLIVCITVSSLKFSVSPIGKKALLALSSVWLLLAIFNVKITVPLWESQEALTSWIISENPESIYAINLRSMHLLEAGDAEAAIETVGEVTSLNPNFQGYLILAKAHFGLGICRDAAVYYDYAYRFGLGRQKIEALVSLYKVEKEMDSVAAEKTKNTLLDIVESDEEYIDLLARIDAVEVNCWDKVVAPLPETGL